MRNIFRTFIFVIAGFYCLQGQEIIELYEDMLGEKVTRNQFYKEQINIKLTTISVIDPTSIYHLIENTHLQVNLGIRDPQKNNARLLSKKTLESKKKINQWNEQQKLYLRMNTANTAQIHIIERYLDRLVFKTKIEFAPFDITPKYPNDSTRTIPDIADSTELQVDLNKMNFYLYRYFSGNISNTYSSDKDYSLLLNGELENLIKYFRDIFENTESLTKNEKEYNIEKALRYPYIFAGTYLQYIVETTDFRLVDLLKKLTGNKIIPKSTLGIQIFNSLTLLNNASGNFNYKRSFVEINNKVTAQIQTGFFLGLSYSLPVKEVLSPFSSIKIDAGIAIANFITTDAKISELKDAYIYNPRTNEVFAGSYNVKEGNHNYNGYFFRIYSPIYFVTDRFYFEAGIGYFHTDIKINYEIFYDTRADLDYPDKETFSYSEDQDIPGVVFNLNYKLFENVLLKLDSFIPMQFIICFEYQYEL